MLARSEELNFRAVAMQARDGSYWRLRLLGGILLFIVVGWFSLGRLDAAFFQLRLRVVEATFGEAETRIEGRAYLLRQEHVAESPAPGRVTLLVGEGRRVRTGEVIVEVNNEGTTGQVPMQLQEMNRRLNRLDAAAATEQGRFLRQRNDVADRLADAERVLRDALASADSDAVADAERRRDRFAQELRRIDNTLVQIEQERDRARDELLNERQALLARRPADVALVRSDTSGYISFSFDGLEAIFTPGAELVTFQQVPDPSYRQVEDGLVVGRGDGLFRVVEGERLEVVVRAGRTAPLETGSNVILAFASVPERQFSGRVLEVLQPGNELLMRIGLDAFDQSLVHLRFDEVAVSAQQARGIVVPTSAIAEVNGNTGVYVMIGDRPVFRRVRVLGGDDRRAVIDGIDGVPQGARVVANPQVVIARRR